MKEQFVPYEIAKLLKQKGFNEYCLGLYQKNKKLIYAKPNNVWNNFWTDDELTGKITKPGNLTSTWKQEEIDEERKKGNTFESCVGYAAPLWQQCLEWLEREHWVDFWVVPILTPNPKQYECFIMYRGKEISCEILGIRFFNSYNEARQTAVEKILKHM